LIYALRSIYREVDTSRTVDAHTVSANDVTTVGKDEALLLVALTVRSIAFITMYNVDVFMKTGHNMKS
jgi:hypothetical protein